MRPLFIFALLIGAAMMLIGIAIVQTPEAVRVSALAKVSALAGLLRISHSGEEANADLIGYALVLFGFLSVLSSSLECASVALRLLFLIPIQTVVWIQLWSIGYAILVGQYPDGYVPAGGTCLMLANVGSCFILADQIITFNFLAAFAFFFARAVTNPDPYIRDYRES